MIYIYIYIYIYIHLSLYIYIYTYTASVVVRGPQLADGPRARPRQLAVTPGPEAQPTRRASARERFLFCSVYDVM